MNSNQLPQSISLKKHAEQGYQWQGECDLSDFSRLTDIIKQKADTKTTISVSLQRQGGIIWLKCAIKADTQLQCQRCLNPMDFNLDKQITIALLESKEQSSLLQDDEDWLLLAEITDDEHNDQLPIIDIIEDELLLALPLAPKHDANHEDCLPVEFIDEEEEEQEEKENPFAILQQLKSKD